MYERKGETMGGICDFCGKGKGEVDVIVNGPDVYICNECIDICNELVEEIREEVVRQELNYLAFYEMWGTDI
jgi:ATP-dependent protease Clp ATPase subunit